MSGEACMMEYYPEPRAPVTLCEQDIHAIEQALIGIVDRNPHEADSIAHIGKILNGKMGER